MFDRPLGKLVLVDQSSEPVGVGVRAPDGAAEPAQTLLPSSRTVISAPGSLWILHRVDFPVGGVGRSSAGPPSAGARPAAAAVSRRRHLSEPGEAVGKARRETHVLPDRRALHLASEHSHFVAQCEELDLGPDTRWGKPDAHRGQIAVDPPMSPRRGRTAP
jgi:hypothetical protein